MKSVKDDDGVTWDIEVDFGAIKRIRSSLGIDLAGNVEDVLASLTDPIQMIDVLYVICRKQANDRSLTDEGFGRRMESCCKEAREALCDEVRDFIHRTADAERATLFETARKRSDQATRSLVKQMQEQAEAMDPDKVAAEIMDAILNSGSTRSPDGSTLIPTPSSSEP